MLKKIIILLIIIFLFLVVDCRKDRSADKQNRETGQTKPEKKKIKEQKLELNRGEKLAVLKEIVNATAMQIEGDELFVLDEVVVYVYSLKDFSLLYKFGRKGRGPGEFVYYPTTEVTLQVLKDKVILSRMSKVAVFSRQGKLIKESRKHPLSSSLLKVGKGDFMKRLKFGPPESLTYIALLDNLFKEKKVIYSRKYKSESVDELNKNGFQIFRPASLLLRNSSARLYLYDFKRDNLFLTFDEKGNEKEIIKLKLPRTKVTTAFKKEIMEWILSDAVLKEFPLHYKIVFPQFLPAVKNFTIKDQKIYIQTYVKRAKFSKFYFTNLEGKVERELYLPTAERSLVQMGYNRVWDFGQDKYYYLADNYMAETWELFCLTIR